jgi:inhibitor of KinA
LEFKIISYGKNAVLISFENKISVEVHQKVRFLYESLRRFPEKGIVALTPAYNSLVVYFEPKIQSLNGVSELSYKILSQSKDIQLPSYEVVLPVCYDACFGFDTSFVLEHNDLTFEELIIKHTAPEYLVYMIGFVPGFLYLGGLDEALHTPRLATPRTKIPIGGVGIADNQTGVYPLETPGGWQLIGNCPLNLVGNDSNAVIEMGDIVNFTSITKSEHSKLIGKSPERRLL